jgi:hypothetical protein
MTSTSQDDPAKGATDSESVKNTPEATKEARQVPLDALAASRERARSAEQRVADLEARLAALEKNKGEETDAQPASRQTDDSDLRKQVAEIQHREHLRTLTSELGLADSKQAEAVAGIMAKNADLTPTEALSLAALRQPDIFGSAGGRGFDPNTHGGLRPRSGAPEREVSDTEKRMKAVVDLRTVDYKQSEKILNNYIGSLAAQALGVGNKHQKIPI